MLKPPIRSRVTSSGTSSAAIAPKRGSSQKPPSTSPVSQQTPKKKTSKEIFDTVNSFIQEARLKSKGLDKNDEKKTNYQQRSALYKTTPRTTKTPVQNKVAKQPISQIVKAQTAGKTSANANTKSQQNVVKRPASDAKGKLNDSSGGSLSPKSPSTSQTETAEKTYFDGNLRRLSSERLDYEVSSSDEDSRDSNDDFFVQSENETAKSKVCPEQIPHGLSSLEWKFRPPAAGGNFNELGGEELSPIFQGIQLEQLKKHQSSSKSGNTRQNGQRNNNSETTAEKNIRLKQFYSQQLDAMREKALASLKKFNLTTEDAPPLDSLLENVEGRGQRPLRHTRRSHNFGKPSTAAGVKSNWEPQRVPFEGKSSGNTKFGPKGFNRGDGTFGRGVRVKLENETEARSLLPRS